MRKPKALVSGLLCMLSMLCLALPAFADGPVNSQQTMKEIRQNPDVIATGIFTYGNGDDQYGLIRKMYEGKSLEEYAGSYQAQDVADSLNLAMQNYQDGVQVTHKVYSEQEIAQDADKDKVELYYFPAKEANGKYAIILGGNIVFTSGEMREGVASAAQLHEQGYAVFVLRYRIWMDMSNNASMDDLGAAVKYITDRAEEFGVQTEDYAVFGFSSGGQLAALFGDKEIGYGKYGVPKPGALVLNYAILDLSIMKPVYHYLYDIGNFKWTYYWSNVLDVVNEDYPPVYIWRGENDTDLGSTDQYLEFEAILEELGVPHEMVIYANAPHAIGTGVGTDAEGWIPKAVAFWEQQTAA